MAGACPSFDVTTPVGTLQTAPLRASLAIPPREVTEIEIIIPPGPRGLVGLAIANGDNPVIPYEPNSWLVSDNEQIRWPLEGHITSGAWQLLAYNLGQYPHTVEVRFLV